MSKRRTAKPVDFHQHLQPQVTDCDVCGNRWRKKDNNPGVSIEAIVNDSEYGDYEVIVEICQACFNGLANEMRKRNASD